MKHTMNRRSALGIGGAVATAAIGAGAGFGLAGGHADAATGPQPDPVGLDTVLPAYQRESAKAGGHWHSYVTAVDANGATKELIADDIDYVIHGASVQKLAIALAVLDKVDRGELSLSQKLDLQAGMIAGGSGTYRLQAAFGDDLTLANILVAMLQPSDNTAAQMFGRVVPGAEINDILASKGFVHTRLELVEGDPVIRYHLGTTTPREMHTLLTGLVTNTLFSASGAAAVLRVMTWTFIGYTDGTRRNMSSAERGRMAVKYGADADRRNEVGVIFNEDNTVPLMTFCYFADQLGDQDNYGATNPAVQAHAVLGRTMLDAVNATHPPASPAAKSPR